MLETSRKELDTVRQVDGQYFLYGKKIGTVLLLLVGFLYVKKKVKKVFTRDCQVRTAAATTASRRGTGDCGKAAEAKADRYDEDAGQGQE